MALKAKEQNIAVFGETGSGKTVLLSSFFGATQEPSFRKANPYRVLADDTGQGRRLRQNYLRMRDDAQAPLATRFEAKSYSFTVRPNEDDTSTEHSFNALRLVWHDYPGEWFEEEPSDAEEAQRRIETFKRLMTSDVAVVLIDGQKLLEYAGEEEKYLKSVLWNIDEGLGRLRDDILTDGKPLEEFPRIWVLALSKADLHPTMNVQSFKDLVERKSADDLAILHKTLRSFVEVPEALSLGEDFLLLSSAKFETERIEITNRIGLDLILPIATMLPLERVTQWAESLNIPFKVLQKLVDNADDLARVLTPFIAKILEHVPGVGKWLSRLLSPAIVSLVMLSKDKLQQLVDRAMEDRDYLSAMLAQFRLDLMDGVDQDVLEKSAW
ncbi:TRAFAC clade GTPase domain-containing protein [Ancrocorticia sp.]|uniref:TRAFAC clade GTPase domain-containing protein n=1 Tax=Ancrocorticia sp. TaxID=2593684 RepID=UPI003F8DEB1F